MAAKYESSDSDFESGSSYEVPVPELDETNYDLWREKIKKWCQVTNYEESKRACVISLSLNGSAERVANLIPIEELATQKGVDILLEKLDELFYPDPNWRMYDAWKDFNKLIKKPETSIHKHISEFEWLYYKMQQAFKEESPMQDKNLCYQLLLSCNLSDGKAGIVLFELSDDVSYTNMKATLKRLYANGTLLIPESSHTNVKVEPKVDSDMGGRGKNQEVPHTTGRHINMPIPDSFFSRSNFRGRTHKRPRYQMDRGYGYSSNNK